MPAGIPVNADFGSSAKVIRLFVSCPRDVSGEVDKVRRVASELNRNFTKFGLHGHPMHWKTHCHPGAGRPQAVINGRMNAFDIFGNLSKVIPFRTMVEKDNLAWSVWRTQFSEELRSHLMDVLLEAVQEGVGSGDMSAVASEPSRQTR